MTSYSAQSSPGPAPARGPVAGGRVGLSEYTAQRLAELRARRAADAEAEAVSPLSSSKPSTSTSRTSSGIAPPSQPPPPPPTGAVPPTDSPSRLASSSVEGLRSSVDRRAGSTPSPTAHADTATDGTPTRRIVATQPTSRTTAADVGSSPVSRHNQADGLLASASTAAAAAASSSSALSSSSSSSSPATNGAASGFVAAGRSPMSSSSFVGGSGSANGYQHQLISTSSYGGSNSSSPSANRRPLPGAGRTTDVRLVMHWMFTCNFRNVKLMTRRRAECCGVAAVQRICMSGSLKKDRRLRQIVVSAARRRARAAALCVYVAFPL
jgi:hypothetical protein